MKNLTILGSTGSIGTQTLEIARSYPDRLKVRALAANSNVKLMEEQARAFEPELIAMYDEEAARDLKVRLGDLPVKIVTGMEGLIEVCTLEHVDTVVTAIVGMIGIRPTVAAIRSGKDIALANKETLVTAGHIIMPLAAENNVNILPVDSEHSAIFQCLNGEVRKAKDTGAQESAGRSDIYGCAGGMYWRDIDKILLTASGGPFKGKKRSELAQMTARDALKHPNWDMGAKVTVDSSTLVNKGLEVMEASWLFGVDADDIKVVVQPQSIVHSMVQFRDGAVMAQLGVPDMRLPIRYALFYPDRLPLEPERVDLTAMHSLIFEEPDTETFEGLPLAYRAAHEGGSMPTVFNAANEVAVARFLKDEIGYLEIYDTIRRAMDAHEVNHNPDLDEILDTEAWTREFLTR